MAALRNGVKGGKARGKTGGKVASGKKSTAGKPSENPSASPVSAALVSRNGSGGVNLGVEALSGALAVDLRETLVSESLKNGHFLET